MTLEEFTVPAVCTGVALLLREVFGAIKTKYDANLADKKQNNEDDLRKDESDAKIKGTETEQALAIYREMVNSLRGDVAKLYDSLRKLEEDHMACREENAALRTELKSVKERLVAIEEEQARQSST